MSSQLDKLNELKWKKFPVGSDGFVCLVDLMGDDSSVVQAARVSYGEGTKHTSDDRMLIRYLLRHRHTTPFEMAEIKFLVRTSMDTWRQWIRHRTANVNEYSTRYSVAIDSAQKTEPDKWRSQTQANKQGSAGVVTEWPSDYVTTTCVRSDDNIQHIVSKAHTGGCGDSLDERLVDVFDEPPTPGSYLTAKEQGLQQCAREVYEERLEFGVAREQARKDLPLSTYTQAYWKIDLHNLLHFLGLRMDSHAQQEIREYAEIMGNEIVKPLFPLVWEAFDDYRLGGMFLTRLEVEYIQRILTEAGGLEWAAVKRPDEDGALEYQDPSWVHLKRCRERDEALTKLKKLGLVRSNNERMGEVGEIAG